MGAKMKFCGVTQYVNDPYGKLLTHTLFKSNQ